MQHHSFFRNLPPLSILQHALHVSGTLFLWLLWPSFNAALLPPDYVAQHRSIINTYFSLTASCVVVFVLSPIFQRSGGKWKISMVRKKLVLSILRARDTVAPKAGGKIGRLI